MEENEHYYEELVRRYSERTATDEELQVFVQLLNEGKLDKYLMESMTRDAGIQSEEKIIPETTRVRPLWPRIAAAASILLILSAGTYFITHKAATPKQIAQVKKVDILPGNQSAILQLSNGQQINLNTAKAGNIAKQGNTNITKTADNKVVYSRNPNATEAIAYNTITTKLGNFYPLTLSDGTVAILDAGSSIKYPVNFIGNERRVEITGQVYFEVKHNEKMPFRVSVKGQTIEDIGTHFNINAYDDEPNIKTTLIEGSVKINNQQTLTPGQQAIIANGQIKIKTVNTDQVIAWKNGLFNFEEVPVAEAMRQIARWYDVAIEYPRGIPQNVVFHGGMHRNINASEALDLLSFFKVHFKIVQATNSKKIIVKP